jgi:hypothetical protein
MNNQTRRLREEIDVARKALLELEEHMSRVREVIAKTLRAVDDATAVIDAAEAAANRYPPAPKP